MEDGLFFSIDKDWLIRKGMLESDLDIMLSAVKLFCDRVNFKYASKNSTVC